MIYLVGAGGFVGSAYARLFSHLGLAFTAITRESFDDHRGTACDILINANGNSKKYLADRDPMADFDQSVRSVAETLAAFDAKTYVLLSSGDVYADPSGPATTREAAPLTFEGQSRYGFHKYLAEQIVLARHPDCLVVRMGGFVGPGLKKNAVFDILTGGPVWLDPASTLQFISTDRAAGLVWSLVEQGVRGEVVNLGGRGMLRIGDLHAELGSASPFQDGAPTVRYELSLDKLAGFVGADALPESTAEVAAFVESWRRERGQTWSR